MQELEQRLRLCEMQGVEASSEVQLAARKVAGENQKLRALLNTHGISNDSIEAFLQSGVIAAPTAPSFSSQVSPAATGAAVRTLDGFLGPRQPRALRTGATASNALSMGLDSRSQEAPSAGLTMSSSLWDIMSSEDGQHTHDTPTQLQNESLLMSHRHASNGMEQSGAAERRPTAGSGLFPFDNLLRVPDPTGYGLDHKHRQLVFPTTVATSHYAVSSSAESDGSEAVGTVTGDQPHGAGMSLNGVPETEYAVEDITFSANPMDGYSATTLAM